MERGGEITVKKGENFVTQNKDYLDTLLHNTRKKNGRKGEQYQVLVRYEMEPGARDALIVNGKGSKGNREQVLQDYGIDLEEIGSGNDSVHVKLERGDLNYGLRTGSVDVFNSRIKGFTVTEL